MWHPGVWEHHRETHQTTISELGAVSGRFQRQIEPDNDQRRGCSHFQGCGCGVE